MELSRKAFKEFIELCEDVTCNDTVVLELLQKRYNSTNPHFLWSREFLDLVNRCRQKILADRSNKYVFIMEFTTELKAYKAKPLKHLCQMHHIKRQTTKRELISEDECSSKRLKLENAKGKKPCCHKGSSVLLGQVVNPSCTLIPLSLMSEMTTEMPENRNCTREVSGGDSGDGEAKGRSVGQEEVKGDQSKTLEKVKLQRKSDSEASSSCQRDQLMESVADCQSHDVSLTAAEQVSNVALENIFQQETEDKMQENRLQKKISNGIQRLQETELTLDDMDQEDSMYTLEDRYKKRFVKVWNRLCRLKDQRPTTGRATERRLHYAGTNYPEINRKISRFVNRLNVFPDYGDIHEIIKKCNERNGLGMCKDAIDRLSQNTFTDVGNILQKRRLTDFVENFGCHLTDSLRFRDDPAWSDWSLRQKLESNRKISMLKLDEVINKFAQRQETEGDDEEEEEEEEENDNDDMDEMQLMEDMEDSDVLDILDEGKEVESQKEDDEALEGECHLMRESEDERKIEGSVAIALDESSLCGDDVEAETVKIRRTPIEFNCPAEAVVDRAEDEGTYSCSGRSRDSCFPLKEFNYEREVHSSAGNDEKRDDQRFIPDSGGTEQLQCQPTKNRSQSLTDISTAAEDVQPPLSPDSFDGTSDDVICIDDSLSSPQSASTALHFCHLSKMSDLTLTAVKLNAPSESVMRKYMRSHSSPSASTLVPQQQKEQLVGNEATLLSEDDDVIVVNSGDTLCRNQQANGITLAERGLTVRDDGDKYCILSTIQEQVITHDMTSSADSCFTQETTTRKRVLSQIVCLNNTQNLQGTSDAQRQHSSPCVQMRGSKKSRDLRPQTQLNAPLRLDIDSISRDTASSVFKNLQKKHDSDDLSRCHLQVAVQPSPTDQVPGGLGMSLQTTRIPCSRKRQNVRKLSHSTSERSRQQKPTKLKAKMVSSPRTSIAERPLRQKNAGYSEVIELN